MNDRHVLLTGGSGGLGIAVTRALLARGAHLTLTVRDDVHAQRLTAFLDDLDDEARARVRTAPADLADEASVRGVIDAMPRVDCLIHLVGGFTMGPLDETSLEALREQIDLNLVTTFLVCKHALRRMKERGHGRIVTVGSRAAVEPGAQLSAYAATKAGVLALTRVIADETRDTDITANAVLPSIIDTAANRKAMGESQAERWVTPESLAEVILFLASEAARDVRGALLPVYGKV
ncbi:MAG: 3-oxoacyl-ACP reductase FabG [Nannocystaceae bacterium]